MQIHAQEVVQKLLENRTLHQGTGWMWFFASKGNPGQEGEARRQRTKAQKAKGKPGLPHPQDTCPRIIKS